MRNSFASRRSQISPAPHGQSPEIARTSVLFPVPDSPATRTRPQEHISTSASFQPAPPAEDGAERRVEPGALLVLTAEERYALAVLAQPREPIAILRLRLVLVLRHDDEAPADHDHRPARDDGIEHRGDDEKARDRD